ncbi:MAG: alcohol dehydrogenase catalytic domain-containing protein [Janthinobacterium lividum]
MKAVLIQNKQLGWADAPQPITGPRELLIRVERAALNAVDLRKSTSHFGDSAADAPPIGGLECAGVVAAVGAEAVGFTVGDRVMTMQGGAQAQWIAVDYQLVAHVPEHFSFDEGAATLVSYLTAHNALRTQGGMRAGDTVLIQGVTSSAGLAAAHLAQLFGAAAIVGTSRSAHRDGQPAGLEGCQVVTPDRAAETLAEGPGRRGGADVVIDMVGASVAQITLACAALHGRWIDVGRLGGAVAQIDLTEFARKQLRLIGVTFRTRSTVERIAILDAFKHEVLPALVQRKLPAPQLDRVFPMAEIAAAHDYARTRTSFGKITLDPWTDA